MAPPLDEGDVMPRSGFEQGVAQALPGDVGHEAVIGLVGGTDDGAVEEGGIQGREPKGDEGVQGWVGRRGRCRIWERTKYGRWMGGIIVGGVLGRKGIESVHCRFRAGAGVGPSSCVPDICARWSEAMFACSLVNEHEPCVRTRLCAAAVRERRGRRRCADWHRGNQSLSDAVCGEGKNKVARVPQPSAVPRSGLEACYVLIDHSPSATAHRRGWPESKGDERAGRSPCAPVRRFGSNGIIDGCAGVRKPQHQDKCGTTHRASSTLATVR